MDCQCLFGISMINSNCRVLNMRICHQFRFSKMYKPVVIFSDENAKCGYIYPWSLAFSKKTFPRRSLDKNISKKKKIAQILTFSLFTNKLFSYSKNKTCINYD